MTIANWCVLIACMLPIATIGIAKMSSAKFPKTEGRYDNHHPREWAEHLTGWQRRANAAQNNGWEALPLFIAAVLLAQQAHADQGHIDMLAMAFVGLRCMYIAAYIFNLGSLRTIIWAAGMASSIAIFLMS